MSRAQQPPGSPLDGYIGEPPKLTFPDGWTLSGAWRRAQTADAHLGPVDAAHFDVLLSRPEAVSGDWGSKHRVLFAIQNGALRADCDCKSYLHRGWCAHVATLWWRWTREQIGVTDLDADHVHLSPPWWLSIEDENGGGRA